MKKLYLVIFSLIFYQSYAKSILSHNVNLLQEKDFRNAVENFCKYKPSVNFCSEEHKALLYKLHQEQQEKLEKEKEARKREREKMTAFERLFSKNNQYRFLGDFSTFPFDFF